MEQKLRENLMKEFRTGSMSSFITTDLLACGIDVQQGIQGRWRIELMFARP